VRWSQRMARQCSQVIVQAPTSKAETQTSQGGENNQQKNPMDKMALPGIRRHYR
jgi:hypothetical protein